MHFSSIHNSCFINTQSIRYRWIHNFNFTGRYISDRVSTKILFSQRKKLSDKAGFTNLLSKLDLTSEILQAELYPMLYDPLL